MKILFVTLLQFLFLIQAYGSERVDSIIDNDVMETLENISIKKEEIKNIKKTLDTLGNQLKKVKKGQTTYVRIRNVSGTLAIIAIAAGAYTARFPKGIRLTGLKLMFSSYLAVTTYGESMVTLNQTDIENLSRDIIMNRVKISKLEKSMAKQIVVLCAEDPRHILCYK